MGVARVPNFVTLLVFMNRVHLSYIKTRGTSNAIMQEICQSSGSSACIVLPDIGMSSQFKPSQLRLRSANDTPSVLQYPNVYARVFPLNEIDKLKDSFIF